MKIRVKSEDVSLRLWLPTNLIFGKAMVWLANTAGRKYAPDAMKDISPENLELLFAEFRRIKKKYGSWELVEVQSADGTHIHIVL